MTQEKSQNGSSVQRSRKKLALKACIFATGLAGIVAEYVMATLASYLLGNAVIQWTLVISLMLFAMGVGSRLSRHFTRNLLDSFIAVELVLSILCAASALLTYFLAAYLDPVGPAIYLIAFAIGLLIGLEIPLATRLNQVFEELRVNISSVMEKDYFGALLGGLIFAFVALPHLGLTYTPIALGGINFLVACILFFLYRGELRRPRLLTAACAAVPATLLLLAAFAQPVTLFSEQRHYRDKIVHQEQSRYQKIVVTRWKDHHWLYLDSAQQFSSYDEERYHEPLVHPALLLSARRSNLLFLGAGDGLAVREALKHPEVESITLVDLDPAVVRLARTHPALAPLNRGALADPRVEIIYDDAYSFLRRTDRIFDAIIVDLPDPRSLGLARLYSREFYGVARRHLTPGGVIATQATSPFFSLKSFLCILKTVRSAGFAAVPLHNHIPTMGEWGFVVGLNVEGASPQAVRRRLAQLDFNGIETRFLSQDAMISMLHFGKGTLDRLHEVKVSTELDPVVYGYYQDGEWDFY